MDRKMVLVSLLLLSVLWCAGTAFADEIIVRHALITEGTAKQHTSINVTGNPSTYQIGPIVNRWSDGATHESFLKYLIPDLGMAPGEMILSVEITCDVWQIYGLAPGCVAQYIADDSWNPNGVGGPVSIPVGAAWQWDPGTAIGGRY